MEIFNKKGLTFIELLISVTISIIVFIIIFSFVIDSITNLAISNRKAEILSKIYIIYNIIGSYRNEYSFGNLVINNPIGNGNDVVLIKNINNDKGIIFGIIDTDTMKLETGSGYQIYGDKAFGFKLLSLRELTNIQSNTGEVFDLSFDTATIFDIPMKTFQADFFNSGSIFLLDLELLISYNKEYDGILWSDIPKSNYELFKLNFTF